MRPAARGEVARLSMELLFVKDDGVSGVEGSPSTSDTTKQRHRAPPGVQQRDNILDNLVMARPDNTTHPLCLECGILRLRMGFSSGDKEYTC
jgi:hypothetical protein